MDQNDALLKWLPVLLQTSDTFFPTGAYAHSLGFEELVKLGGVTNPSQLQTFVTEQILPALQHQELPWLRFAYDEAVLGDLGALCEIDRGISAWKLSAELRSASTQIGQRRLAALLVINRQPLYEKFQEAIRSGKARGHHLSVCALQAAVEGFPLDAAMMAWIYQSISGVCGAALKLIRIGQEGCQRILRDSMSHANAVAHESLKITRENAGWFDPALEIASMRHAFAGERLFIS